MSVVAILAQGFEPVRCQFFDVAFATGSRCICWNVNFSSVRGRAMLETGIFFARFENSKDDISVYQHR